MDIVHSMIIELIEKIINENESEEKDWIIVSNNELNSSNSLKNFCNSNFKKKIYWATYSSDGKKTKKKTLFKRFLK